ncbi:RagB/SusD family nutrient uptake outer membrane protein [Deminuibacter soli]|uniref:RagB/SusD family nutrient uptake outer membrane protein n=1 Tax=Deminuibacter soli TaxID=2291815 RepID=A0A3E1NJT8_9BACT|nr:RagB/SusD family nutrient uptake outer membrane protein [Deminuibacter soli]RFM28193.1 RagB/SusD family nutrient uptake outer membrane protein [Deminuibacter soli]
MKLTYKHPIHILLLAGITFNACKKDFLNTKPLGEVQATDVWKDPALTEAFVTDIYNGLGNGGLDEQELSSLSDEAVFTHSGRGINVVNEGTLGPSNLGWVSETYMWGIAGDNKDMYTKIGGANLALEQLPTVTFPDTALVHRLQGELHFLRAYYYHQLVRYYGGVPIVKKSYNLNQDYSIVRSSFEDCVNFITTECDSAVMLLSGRNMALGRANANAALALKARILLYAASDLHDMPTAKSKSPVIAAYANPELLGYVSGDRVARWQKAYDAALAVINAAPAAGYKLNLTAPVSAEEGRKNYVSLSMGGGSKYKEVDGSAASELLFLRSFTANIDDGGKQVGLHNGPNGYHNWAGNTPIQQLVDDYEYMDSTDAGNPKAVKFDWNNTTQAAAPYKNRDPRFYASIMYDGAPWKPRNLISGNVDPASQIQTGSYETAKGMLPGLDTRQSSIENWNGSWTGYYMRKFIDPDPTLVDNTTRQLIPWPFFRYTEAVLNLAEAAIELGRDEEARSWLNKIRFRAGMPALTESGDALRQRYRNERRVELVYEEHRYHDARRWMIAPETLGRKIKFINITGKLKPGATAPSPYKHDESVYTYTYKPQEDVSLENRQWLDKMYFRPISRDEMNKNTKLVQNPGY